MDPMHVEHPDSVELHNGDALIVVDMQNDFMPGGALAVEDGDAVVGGVNALMARFKQHHLAVVFTQDWHPADHASFASRHAGKQPLDLFEAPGIGPVLWPDHCVQGTAGAEFHPDLKTAWAETIIRKGYRQKIDSYSGFLENDRLTETGLDGYLRGRGVQRIFVCGLAADYCVFFTAADGAEKGYTVFYLGDLTRPVGSPPGSMEKARAELRRKGVRCLTSDAIRAGQK